MAAASTPTTSRSSGDSTADFSNEKLPSKYRQRTVENVDGFYDRTISVRDWAARTFDDIPGQIKAYFIGLFPILTWFYRYNLTWFIGDLIAGVTVGCVVVPQSMSYGILAGLTAEYGLYSSFMGVFIYCFFATSKDVTIGPVAVMSLEVAKVIAEVEEATHGKYTKPEIATCLAFICGAICLGIGLLRLGFILEFIPAPAVTGFMTGSAFTIATTQFPALLGISKEYVNSRDSSYLVIINSLKNLKHAKLDAAFGLTALFGLYAIRFILEWASKRYPKYRRACFFATVMRNGVVVIFITLISWLVTRHDGEKKRIKILLDVPRGFQDVGAPRIDTELLSAMAKHIPVATIILLLEHIAIAKSFGRINDYKIRADQELIAIGATNVLGTFFSAYPATGSFSRTALKSKSGVRTPAAGIITGIVVLLSLYALTDAFYWIPMAGLAAVIIHAVLDVMAPPSLLYTYWKVQPLEALIFLGTVFTTIFADAESGIYMAVASSAAVLLYRICRPRGQFLGRLKLSDGKKTRDMWVPLDKRVLNPNLKVANPPPGVIVFRPTESFTYPNSATQADVIVDEVKRTTRRGKANAFPTLGDRPWNDGGPRKGYSLETILADKRPILRAVVLDFSAVATIDTTGVQALVDMRRQLEKYADREVEFHFANIISPWVRRSLLAGGFGTGKPMVEVRDVAPVLAGDHRKVVNGPRRRADVKGVQKGRGLWERFKAYCFSEDYKDGRFAGGEEYALDEEEGGGKKDGKEGNERAEEDHGWAPVLSEDTPFFHIDIPDLEGLPWDEKANVRGTEAGGSTDRGGNV